MSPAGFLAKIDGVDPRLRTKLYTLPEVIAGWLAPHGGFAGRKVLDLGCGFGETAAGIALAYDPAVVHGVEIGDKPRRCLPLLRDAIGLSALPDNLRFHRVTEGDLGLERDFDVVVNWSVFEHVRRGLLDDFIGRLAERMRPGALLFTQISPLYFSPEGSHLWSLGYRRWEHLLRQSSEVRADLDAAPALTDRQRTSQWRMFERLNRITAPELLRRFEKAGFTLLRLQTDMVDFDPPAPLLDAYTPEALKTFQVVLLLRKT